MRFVSNSKAFRPGLGSSRTFGAAGFPVPADWYAAPDEPDRRRLLAWSRHDATPRQLLVELTADGADYVPADDPPRASLAATVRRLLPPNPTRPPATCSPSGHPTPRGHRRRSCTATCPWRSRATRSSAWGRGTRMSELFRRWMSSH